MTRTSGSCDWRATTDVSWIILASTSGSGSGLLPFNVAGNGLTSRTGLITLEWTGGRGQVTDFQGTSPDTCQTTLTVSGQNTIAVPLVDGFGARELLKILRDQNDRQRTEIGVKTQAC